MLKDVQGTLLDSPVGLVMGEKELPMLKAGVFLADCTPRGLVLPVLAALGSWLVETGHRALRGSEACVQWVAGFTFRLTERHPERPMVHGRTRPIPYRLSTQPSWGWGATFLTSVSWFCSRVCLKPGC